MQEKILKALSGVKYPGFDKDIVSLGMVGEVNQDGGAVVIKMKSVSAGDDVKKKIADEIVAVLSPLNIKADVQFPSAPAAPQPGPPPKKPIPGVKRVIPVASGKGGVGKSTISVNLAVALAKKGHKTGLLDLDVFGPSIPTMLGIDGMHAANEKGELIPKEKYGVKVVSLGLLMEKDAPLIWRGPLVMKIVNQMLYETAWGELDYLVMDLPPGTGDVQLSLVQSVPIDGAVVVTTPQDVALADVAKAINMFDRTGTRVLGIIENMSVFVCPHCSKESSIFGSGGGKRESERRGVPLLGEIPLEGKITETGDKGEPAVLSDEKIQSIFEGIISGISSAIAKK